MDLLSKPERELLEWLGKPEKPVTLEQLEHAPSYSVRRRQKLVKDGMIDLPDSGFLDSAPRTYAISDKGRAALETSTLTLDSDRRSKIALAISALALLVSFVALVSDFI